VFIRYSGAHLCGRHFSDFVERRVKHEIRRQMDIMGGERIALAVSGGKDSMTMMTIVSAILGDRRDVDMCVITVDEGIEGYRGPSIPLVAEASKRLGLDHKVVSFSDLYKIRMDDIAAADRALSACSYCGVLRRRAMNSAAREWGATHIATGLNLDDTAQSILMNFARGDVERLARLGPHRRTQPGLVRRIQPLRAVPESESMLYAVVNGIEHHDGECPYAPEALRNTYREVLGVLEDRFPGTRHSLLKSHEELQPSLESSCPSATLKVCSCGEPTISDRCMTCQMLESLNPRG
jgi:uncharacterized protein (TIGR00269 family)